MARASVPWAELRLRARNSTQGTKSPLRALADSQHRGVENAVSRISARMRRRQCAVHRPRARSDAKPLLVDDLRGPAAGTSLRHQLLLRRQHGRFQPEELPGRFGEGRARRPLALHLDAEERGRNLGDDRPDEGRRIVNGIGVMRLPAPATQRRFAVQTLGSSSGSLGRSRPRQLRNGRYKAQPIRQSVPTGAGQVHQPSLMNAG